MLPGCVLPGSTWASPYFSASGSPFKIFQALSCLFGTSGCRGHFQVFSSPFKFSGRLVLLQVASYASGEVFGILIPPGLTPSELSLRWLVWLYFSPVSPHSSGHQPTVPASGAFSMASFPWFFILQDADDSLFRLLPSDGRVAFLAAP